MRKAAQDLAELVNDLLDLAKVEAGKTVVRPVEFEVENLFGALRGMLRPLLVDGDGAARVRRRRRACPRCSRTRARSRRSCATSSPTRSKFTERGEIRVGAAAGRRRQDGGLLGGRHRHRHRRRRPRARSSRSSGRSRTRCRGSSRGRGWASPSPASWPSCWAARSRWRASSAAAPPSASPCRIFYGGPRPRRTAGPGHPPPRWIRPGSPSSWWRTARRTCTSTTGSCGARRSRSCPPAPSARRRQRRAALPVRAIILDVQLAGGDTWSYLARLKGAGRGQPAGAGGHQRGRPDQGGLPRRRRLRRAARGPGLAAAPPRRADRRGHGAGGRSSTTRRRPATRCACCWASSASR